jgi:hypothetical protein
MKTLLCTLILATLGTAVAKADSLTITFDQPNQFATPGQTLQFFGTIKNNTTDTIFLNSDSFTLNGLSLTFEDLFANTPIFIAAGATSSDVELFDVAVSNPLLDLPALYSGSYTLIGGNDKGTGTAQDNLGTASFSVNTTTRTTSPVPEPATLYLLLGGLTTLAPFARRMRR